VHAVQARHALAREQAGDGLIGGDDLLIYVVM
jgi:hypothetical protein